MEKKALQQGSNQTNKTTKNFLKIYNYYGKIRRILSYSTKNNKFMSYRYSLECQNRKNDS